MMFMLVNKYSYSMEARTSPSTHFLNNDPTSESDRTTLSKLHPGCKLITTELEECSESSGQILKSSVDLYAKLCTVKIISLLHAILLLISKVDCHHISEGLFMHFQCW